MKTYPIRSNPEDQFAAMGLCIVLLAACQSKPAGLTPEQIAVLQKNGFSQTDAGWELGLDAKVLFGNNPGISFPPKVSSQWKNWRANFCTSA